MHRHILVMHGYDGGRHAPGIKNPATAPYRVVHTLLKAHAVAYDIYHRDFFAKQQGKVGISCDSQWYEPADPNNPEDLLASDRALQFRVGPANLSLKMFYQLSLFQGILMLL